jgi:hypothetical protein
VDQFYEFATKKDCQLRDLPFQLKDPYTGLPLDITGCTVYFRMRRPNASADHIREVCQIDDAALGWITYEWSTASVGTVGMFEADFQVRFPDTRIMPLPDSYYFKVQILP